MQFTDIRATPPDLEALAGRQREFLSAVESASSVEECMTAFESWDDVRMQVVNWDAMVDVRFYQDTRDPERKADREAWDAARPRWTELEVQAKRALLAHPLRAELEHAIGEQAFALWTSDVLAFDPAIKNDLVRESTLEAEYTDLVASAAIEYRGEVLNLSMISKFRHHADRDVRHGGEAAQWAWVSDNGAQFDRIFDDMVRVRTAIAEKLGCKDFVEVGYRRMNRVDYDREDVERFRSQVVRNVVPLCAEIRLRQARELGVDDLMKWDEYVFDSRGNAVPKGDRAWMVNRAQEMFDEIGGGLGEFYRLMNDGGFLDLDSRPGKADVGFCTFFPVGRMPFVFANFNGTQADVDVFTHEMGHAFQAYSSQRLRPSDYHWPTQDGSEVHSMGLEMLAYPWMELFFGEDADRYRRAHLTGWALHLAWGSAVDHFQHLIYENPTATPAERRGMWQEMERTYLPWTKYGDLDHLARGGRWQLMEHIHCDPFYYIDYVLAQTCALQLWAQAEEDREGTMKAYVALCQRGGALPFQALVRSAGMRSPFDEGCFSTSWNERARPWSFDMSRATEFGDRLRARSARGQETEAAIACNILNRMFELGPPASVVIPR